jgi:hypothetical protein
VGSPLPHPRVRAARRSITEHRAGSPASLLYGLSKGLVESVNTKLRLLTRIAFGFHSPDALISLAMLALGGRPTPTMQAGLRPGGTGTSLQQDQGQPPYQENAGVLQVGVTISKSMGYSRQAVSMHLKGA